MDLPTGLKDKKMAHSTQRPGGGKPRQPAENERVVLSVRVTPQLKARIDQAALKSGRSQSQQVEHALARDAEREDLLVDALRLSTGLQQAGLLVAIVEAFRCVGQVGAHISRRDGHAWDPEAWLDNVLAYETAASAVRQVFEQFHPNKAELGLTELPDKWGLVRLTWERGAREAAFFADCKGYKNPMMPPGKERRAKEEADFEGVWRRARAKAGTEMAAFETATPVKVKKGSKK